MTPRLFDASATEYTTLGLGMLTDCIRCEVTREVNGVYEAEIEYPVTGRLYTEIGLRSIILIQPDDMTDFQAFRVYRMTRPMSGRVIINAQHISYDLSGYVCPPFMAETIGQALTGIVDNTSPACPFVFTTTRSTSAVFAPLVPCDVWSLMAGQEGSLLDVYGGEYDFNNFEISFDSRIGQDNGVVIRYGKNLKTISQESNNAAVYTAVFPYWTDAERTTVVTLEDRIVEAPGTYDFERVMALDLSDRFENAPTEEQLQASAESYIAANDIGKPDVSIDVDFVHLWQTEEYKDTAILERVSLGDTVTVQFEQMNIEATARVVSYVYDALLERYTKMTIGKVKQSFADTVAAQQKEIEKRPTASLAEKISQALSDRLLGVHGGAVRLLDTNDDGAPDTLYIADNPDPNQAVKVWRFNYAGWAASSNGFNGPFTMGATLDDGLLASFITAANLTAGYIRSADGTTFNLDLDNGILEMNAGKLLLNGNNIDSFFHIDTTGAAPVVTIGAADNPVLLRQTNDRIEFCDQSGNVLAYWSNSSFALVSLQSFTLGNMKIISQPNGSVSFVGVS